MFFFKPLISLPFTLGAVFFDSFFTGPLRSVFPSVYGSGGLSVGFTLKNLPPPLPFSPTSPSHLCYPGLLFPHPRTCFTVQSFLNMVLCTLFLAPCALVLPWVSPSFPVQTGFLVSARRSPFSYRSRLFSVFPLFSIQLITRYAQPFLFPGLFPPLVIFSCGPVRGVTPAEVPLFFFFVLCAAIFPERCLWGVLFPLALLENRFFPFLFVCILSLFIDISPFLLKSYFPPPWFV